MEKDEWHPVDGILMTSARIPAYGGMRISGDALREFASQIRPDDLPFHAEHDLSRPLRVRKFEPYVHSRDDGIDELRFTAEVHSGDIELMRSFNGMSATISEPIARDESVSDERNELVRLMADHTWFDDESLIAAETALMNLGLQQNEIRIERAFQFSAIPDAQIFLVYVYPVLSSIGASALWDAIKVLMARRKTPVSGESTAPTILNVEIRDGDRTLIARAVATDEATGERAFSSLDTAIEQFFQDRGPDGRPSSSGRSVTVWDAESTTWTPPT